jgi:hypothetical protein
MLIPDGIRKCVVYLGIEVSDGDFRKISYRGTGFCMAVPAEKVPPAWFGYIVTAKHVAIHFKDKEFYVRANTPDGRSIDIKAPKETKWFFHPTDDAADVAICRFDVSPGIIDAQSIPPTAIVREDTRKLLGLGVGEQVFIVGLFVYHKGNKKNIPIVRVGNIAMNPDERIKTSMGEMEAYLIEARSIGGLSGSPVFVIEDAPPKDYRIHLLGLIHGHWHEKPETIMLCRNHLISGASVKG